MVPRKRDSKAVRILTLLLIISLISNGLQFAFLKQVNDNNTEYTTALKENYHKRETGYKIRIDALSRTANAFRLRADSLLDRHHDLIRQDSILAVELRKVKGKFSNLSADQVRRKMIEEFEKSK